jgi:hypothetical protein
MRAQIGLERRLTSKLSHDYGGSDSPFGMGVSPRKGLGGLAVGADVLPVLVARISHEGEHANAETALAVLPQKSLEAPAPPPLVARLMRRSIRRLLLCRACDPSLRHSIADFAMRTSHAIFPASDEAGCMISAQVPPLARARTSHGRKTSPADGLRDRRQPNKPFAHPLVPACPSHNYQRGKND